MAKGFRATGQDNYDSFSNFAAFPLIGDSEKIYNAEDTNLLYRWDGIAYQQVGGSAGLTIITTVANAETASGTDNKIIYVVENESWYRYEDSAAAYVRDGLYILDTAEAGNTRWIGVAGKYILGNLNIGGTLTIANQGVGTNPTLSSNSANQEATLTGDLVVSGDFTVNGTTTTIDTTTLLVEDKNIEMGAVTTPTDITADGGGITLKGDTDKTIIWDNANDNWTSSEHFNIPTGKAFKINNVDINTGGTLANVAYKDQANTFTANQTIDNGGLVNSVLNINGSIDSYIRSTATDLLQIGHNGATPISINGTGEITLQKTLFIPSSDSTTAYQFFKADGTTPIMTIDSTNNVLEISDATYPTIRLNNKNITLADDSTIGKIDFYTSDLSAPAPGIASYIECRSNLTDERKGELILATGTAGTVSEKIRVDSDGRLKLTNGIIAPVSDGTTAIQITKADGTTGVLAIDTTNSRLTLNTTTTIPYEITTTQNQAYIKINSSSASNVLFGNYLGHTFFQSPAGKDIQFWTNNGGNKSLAISSDGTSIFKMGSDSTTAFQLKDASGNVDFNYDSTNTRIGVGTTAPLTDLQLGDNYYSSASISTGYNAIALGNGGLIQANTVGVDVNIISGLYFDGSDWRYAKDNTAGSAWLLNGATISKLAGTSTSHSAGDVATLSTQFAINEDGNVGVGTATAISKVDISNGGLGLTVGADSLADTRTNATTKNGRIGFAHYTNAEEPFSALVGISNSTDNILYVGGGSSIQNSSTSIRFYTYATNAQTTGTERMRIDGNGNVGIGTPTITNKVNILGGSTLASNIVNQESTSATYGAYYELESARETWTIASMRTGDGSEGALGIYRGAKTTGVAGYKFIITENDNVGIGTTTPTSPSSFSRFLNIHGVSDASLELSGSSLTESWTLGATSNGFQIRDDGTERLRIGTNGDVFSNTSIGSTNDGFYFGIDGPFQFSANTISAVAPYKIMHFYGSQGQCIIRGDGDVENTNGNYGTISDERVKENIVTARNNYLDDLMKIELKNFNFIGKDQKNLSPIAQEVEKIFPNLVKTAVGSEGHKDKDGNEIKDLKTIKQSIFTWLNLASIQELKNEIGYKTTKTLDESLDTIMSDEENNLDLHTQIEMLTQIAREQNKTIQALTETFEQAGFEVKPKQSIWDKFLNLFK